MPLPKEPTIVINGTVMGDAHAMTIRVALNSFLSDLKEGDLKNSLGELGELYAKRVEEIFAAMGI